MKIILAIICILIAGCNQDPVKMESKTESATKKRKAPRWQTLTKLQLEIINYQNELRIIIKSKLKFSKEEKLIKFLEEEKARIMQEIKKRKEEMLEEMGNLKNTQIKDIKILNGKLYSISNPLNNEESVPKKENNKDCEIKLNIILKKQAKLSKTEDKYSIIEKEAQKLYKQCAKTAIEESTLRDYMGIKKI